MKSIFLLLFSIIIGNGNLNIPKSSADLNLYELTQIEKIIKLAVNENIQLTENNVNLSDYKRQYVPVVTSKGDKEIWINFFCEDWGDNEWKTKIMSVQFGGSCYFNLKVNLTKKVYYNVIVNDDNYLFENNKDNLTKK